MPENQVTQEANPNPASKLAQISPEISAKAYDLIMDAVDKGEVLRPDALKSLQPEQLMKVVKKVQEKLAEKYDGKDTHIYKALTYIDKEWTTLAGDADKLNFTDGVSALITVSTFAIKLGKAGLKASFVTLFETSMAAYEIAEYRSLMIQKGDGATIEGQSADTKQALLDMITERAKEISEEDHGNATRLTNLAKAVGVSYKRLIEATKPESKKPLKPEEINSVIDPKNNEHWFGEQEQTFGQKLRGKEGTGKFLNPQDRLLINGLMSKVPEGKEMDEWIKDRMLKDIEEGKKGAAKG